LIRDVVVLPAFLLLGVFSVTICESERGGSLIGEVSEKNKEEDEDREMMIKEEKATVEDTHPTSSLVCAKAGCKLLHGPRMEQKTD